MDGHLPSDFNFVLHVLKFSIFEHVLDRVTRQILGIPDIATDRLSGRQSLGGSNHQQSSSRTDIKDSFIALPLDQVKHSVSNIELPQMP
jgi:hypothetical protein